MDELLAFSPFNILRCLPYLFDVTFKEYLCVVTLLRLEFFLFYPHIKMIVFIVFQCEDHHIDLPLLPSFVDIKTNEKSINSIYGGK